MVRTDANELKPFRGNLTWFKLPQKLMNNRTVYGPETLDVSPEPGIDDYKGQPLTSRYIRLLRLGGADVDTLEWESTFKVVNDNKIRNDKIEVYYNGKKINTLHTKDYSTPWIITIQK